MASHVSAVGLVDGHRVGEADVTGVDVAGGDVDDAACELDAHRVLVGVDLDDDAAVAVADAEPAVVAQHHHLVARLDRHAADVEDGAGEVGRRASART